MCLSRSLLRTGSREIGPQFPGLCLSADLGIGTTEETFRLLGNIPVEIERLNNLVTGALMLVATALACGPRCHLAHLTLKHNQLQCL